MIWVLTHKFLSNSAAGILSNAIVFRGHLRQWEDGSFDYFRRQLECEESLPRFPTLFWVFWAKAWASFFRSFSVSQWHLPPSAGSISGRNEACLSLQWRSRFLAAWFWCAELDFVWFMRATEWVLITAISMYSLRTSPSFHLISNSALLALMSSGEGSSGVFPSGLSSCWGWPPRVG